jgi:hypothetical protein
VDAIFFYQVVPVPFRPQTPSNPTPSALLLPLLLSLLMPTLVPSLLSVYKMQNM